MSDGMRYWEVQDRDRIGIEPPTPRAMKGLDANTVAFIGISEWAGDKKEAGAYINSNEAVEIADHLYALAGKPSSSDQARWDEIFRHAMSLHKPPSLCALYADIAIGRAARNA